MSERMQNTAQRIIARVCNERKNSDLRADDPDILGAINENFSTMGVALDDYLQDAVRLGSENSNLRAQLASVQAERDAERSKLDDIAEILRRVGHHPESATWGPGYEQCATDLGIGVESLIATKEEKEFRLVQSLERERLLRVAGQALVFAMETCHICQAELIVEEGPSYCGESGCSYDCEDHEGPECQLISTLHENLKRLLIPAPAAEGGTKLALNES